MPCLTAPLLPVPQLPSPLKIPLGIPDFVISGGVNFCCNIHIPAQSLLELYGALGGPPLPPGPTINLAVINTLLGYIDVINKQFLDKLQISCPLE